jgi:hypothetical protein
MKQSILYILIVVSGLNHSFGQVFLSENPQKFIGAVLTSDAGKPIELRFAYLRPSGIGGFQFKASPGYKSVDLITTISRYGNITGFGSVKTTKELKFFFFEPGILLILDKKDFRRTFFAINFPMGFSKMKIYKQFFNDPVFDNQTKVEFDPNIKMNYSAEIEFLWAFNLSNKSFLETGVSFTLPIKSQELFGASGTKINYNNYIPGATTFPFLNISCSYNFALSE